MQAQANINGRALVVNYGTNPMGQVAGAWAELPDGRVADLDPEEETQMWAAAALDALEQRAKTGVVFAALTGNERTFAFFQAQLHFAASLRNGAGQRFADKDAALGGYQGPTCLQGAWACLPDGAEKLPMAKMEQLLSANGFQIPTDGVPSIDADTALKIKNGEIATLHLNDEAPIAAVDGVHSALHVAPLVEKTNVAQEGGAQ